MRRSWWQLATLASVALAGCGSSSSGGATTGAAGQCGSVPAEGVCANASTISYCGVPTGQGTPRLLQHRCGAGETCAVVGGKAECVVTGECRPGESECLDATTLRTCGNAATWQTTTCATSCKPSALGSFCALPAAVTPLTGRVLFEYRWPNASLTDWEALPRQTFAPLFLVVSRGADGIYDAVYTGGGDGSFTVDVPAAPGADDFVIVAAAADDGAGGLAFAVANPGFATGGEKEIGTVGTPRLWQWSWGADGLAGGQDLLITEGMGSGAANVHFNMLRAYAATLGHYGALGPPLVIWIGSGATWTCGACFAPFPATVFGLPFEGQIWIGADPADQGYWSDAVNEHELGHWVMASFGVSPGEGGPHFVGRPTFPGQAWSEGWATWFSAEVRGDPIYFDKQGGTFFWLDIAAAEYATGSAFVQPRADHPDGLLQLLDENEVAAMAWTLSSLGGSEALFQALASPRMTTPTATRGYTRHRWSYDGGGNLVNVVDTGQGAPSFADFLDALDCAGFSTALIDAATVPATEYPYPSANPICN